MRVLLRRSDGWEKEVDIELNWEVRDSLPDDYVLATPSTDITFTYQGESKDVIDDYGDRTPYAIYEQTREQMKPRR